MKEMINKKILILISLLLFLPLFVGCFGVPPTNQAPTITSTPITTATVDEPYTYNVNATDPDGDTLTYSLTTHPTGMTINSATGVINWIPSVEGDYDIIVEVSDGEKSTTQSFTITVSEEPIIPPYSPPIINPPVNHAPTITSTPATLATFDVLYTYDVNATDSDGDTLTYSLTANPASMTIDSATGLIDWTPAFVQIGDHTVTVNVSDGSLSDTQSFTITVHDVLDYIVVLPETMTLFEGGETDSIDTITAHYNNGTTAVIALGACTYGSNDEAVATVAAGVVTTVADGAATITVTYIEGGITETDTVVVTVNPILLTSITVSPATMTLFVGETGTISLITASYNDGSDQSIALGDAACTYDSDATGVATVAVGVVTGVATGTATITVTYMTMTDTIAVTVVPDILISPSTKTAIVGTPFTIDIVVENVTELQGVSVTLSFDDSKIDYTTAVAGAFLPEPILQKPSAGSVTNQVLLDIAGTGTPNYSSGTGTVITVTFNPIAAGTTDITFYLHDLRHDVSTPISHKVKSECSVTVNNP